MWALDYFGSLSCILRSLSSHDRDPRGHAHRCTVVVGDKTSPPDLEWRKAAQSMVPEANLHGKPPLLVYLDAAAQEALGYRIVRLLPWHHFGRKNVGYLYAMQHGARVILDIDDYNVLLAPPPVGVLHEARQPELLPQQLWDLGKGAPPLYNPYPPFELQHAVVNATSPHWMPSWPRGFPLNHVQDASTRPLFSAVRAAPAPVHVVQLLADGDPDVDAIFRLTRPLPASFARKREAALLPLDTFSPMNAQACLFSRRAFWALLLPVTVHGRVSDIWRSFMFTKLMQGTGQLRAFASNYVLQERNVHTLLADLQAEEPLYERAGGLVSGLRRLRLNSSSLSEAMLELAVALYEVGVVEALDVQLTWAWVADLHSLGISLPPMIAPTGERAAPHKPQQSRAQRAELSASRLGSQRPIRG